MKKFWGMFKVEMKLAVRSIDLLLFGVLMPVGILCLIGWINGSKPAYEGAGYTMLEVTFAALSTVGICATAFMGLPLTLANYRERKILKHFFVTPASPFMLLLVQIGIDFCVCLISLLLVGCTAVFMFGYRMKGSMIVFLGMYLLVMAVMFSLGMMIASVCRTQRQANIVCSIVYFPMLFLSGATIPFELFPRVLQRVAGVLPLSIGINLLKQCSLGMESGNMGRSIMILITAAIAGAVISNKTFRWEV